MISFAYLLEAAPNQPHQFTKEDAAKIIENNKQQNNNKAVVNINTSTTADLLKSNSASQAAQRHGTNAQNAGNVQKNLTDQHIKNQTSTPIKDTNPTNEFKSI